MSRLIPPALLRLLVYVAISSTASATTYYIAANGSDSNNGTSNSTPWAHAPGMPACTNTCASVKPAAGDKLIFRGGDTWHWGNSSASPYVGSGGWTWSWSGSSGHPIYVGVDQTWYSGGSWVRPVFSGDNSISTSFVSSCAYDQSSLNFLTLHQVNFVTVDNFEWRGRCWSSGANSAFIDSDNSANSNLTISNSYFHGWTAVLGGADSQTYLGSGSRNANNNTWDHNVIDGSDSSRGAGNSTACAKAYVPAFPCQSGQGIYMEMAVIRFSIFRYLSNMVVTTNTSSAHDNLFEYLYDTYQATGPHSNVMNQVVQVNGGSTAFYNNIMRHIYVTEEIYFTVGSGGAAYIFNNVFFDQLKYDSSGDSAPSNCMNIQANESSGTQTLYFYNNTVDSQGGTGGGCQIHFDPAGAPTYAWNGTAYFQNNHFIGYSNLSSFYVCSTTGKCGVSDSGNEIFQTETAANSQGYTENNNYAPTTNGGVTVGTGGSLASSCSSFSGDGELCSGTSNGSTEVSADGGEIANFPGIPMVARTGSWDAGAYQFGTSGTQVNPPTGLTAVVQ